METELLLSGSHGINQHWTLQKRIVPCSHQRLIIKTTPCMKCKGRYHSPKRGLTLSRQQVRNLNGSSLSVAQSLNVLIVDDLFRNSADVSWRVSWSGLNLTALFEFLKARVEGHNFSISSLNRLLTWISSFRLGMVFRLESVMIGIECDSLVRVPGS